MASETCSQRETLNVGVQREAIWSKLATTSSPDLRAEPTSSASPVDALLMVTMSMSVFCLRALTRSVSEPMSTRRTADLQ